MKSARPPSKAAPLVTTPPIWPLWLLLAGVIVVAYGNSLGLGLAMDSPLLLRDPRVQTFTTDNLSRIVHEPYWWGSRFAGLYRPVTTFSLLVNYTILGSRENAGGYHFINLLLHLANAGMLFALVRLMVTERWTAWLAAALWAAHPAGSETVTNVAGRADLLAASCVLGGLLWYSRRSRNPSASPVVTGLVLLVVALAGVFSKESAAVLPGLMLLWDITFGAGTRSWKWRLPAYAAAVVAVAVFFAIRQQMPRMHVPMLDNPEVAAGLLGARLTALTVIARYLLLMVWPLRLSADYSYNQVAVVGPGDAAGWLAAGLIVALLAVATLRRRRDPLVFFAAGFFGLTLFPASNLAVIIGSIMAERFLYLPAAGFALAAAVLGARAAQRYAQNKRGIAIGAAVVLTLLTLRTAVRNADWKDDVTLWSASLATSPRSWKVHKGMATALYDLDPERNLEQATRHLETAMSIVLGVPAAEMPVNAMTDLGTCYRLMGDRFGGNTTLVGDAWYRKSVPILERARETDLLADRRAVAAERERGAAVREVFGMPALYLNLGNIYLNLGFRQKALEACRYGRTIEPHNPNFYVAIASIQTAGKDTEAAALTLLEQWLAGDADSNTESRLLSLYRGIPGGECAFTGTGTEARMNTACPRLKNDICVAAAGLLKLMVDARHREEARSILGATVSRFACEAGPLEAVLAK